MNNQKGQRTSGEANGWSAPSITIEPLHAGNLDAAVPLLAEYKYGRKWSEAEVAVCRDFWDRLARSGYAYGLLAREEKRYAGFLTYSWAFSTTKGLPILRVQDLFTSESCRRKGVAKALLGRAEQLARDAGAHRIQLETDCDNEAARSLYGDKAGFLHLKQKIVYMLPLGSWT
jgi:ribosomal protein S18 acetylase RimI-like enzyme